jgi:hypothetical protein
MLDIKTEIPKWLKDGIRRKNVMMNKAMEKEKL